MSKYTVEKLRERSGSYKEQCHLLKAECISYRIMKTIDDSLQLCTQSVEIDWRDNHKQVSPAHLFIDKRHVVIPRHHLTHDFPDAKDLEGFVQSELTTNMAK